MYKAAKLPATNFIKGRSRAMLGFTAEDESFYNLFGITLSKKKRASQYGSALASDLKSEFPDSDYCSILVRSIAGLKARVKEQEQSRQAAKNKADRLKHDEGIRNSRAVLAEYEKKAASLNCSLNSDLSTTVSPVIAPYLNPNAAQPQLQASDPLLGTAISSSNVRTMAAPEAAAAAEPAAAEKKDGNKNLVYIGIGAAVLLIGGYFLMKKK